METGTLIAIVLVFLCMFNALWDICVVLKRVYIRIAQGLTVELRPYAYIALQSVTIAVLVIAAYPTTKNQLNVWLS